MRNIIQSLYRHAAVALTTLALSVPAVWSTSAAEAASRPAIYDTQAEGGKQVAEALARAKKEKKRVLLQFGANWCGLCHRLDTLFRSDAKIAARLKESFVVVLIDVDKGHNAEIDDRYGTPTRLGLPAIVILEADGTPLTTQDTGKLEDGDHHDPEKVLGFLEKWTPQKP